MSDIMFAKPLIVTNSNSLFSLLEEQQEDFEIIKERMCETPKYFKEATNTITKMNSVIDHYIESLDSFDFIYKEDDFDEDEYGKVSPFYVSPNTTNETYWQNDLEPQLQYD